MSYPQTRPRRLQPGKMFATLFPKIGLVLIASCFYFSGCAKQEQVKAVESPPTETAMTVQPQPVPTLPPSVLPSPKLTDVQDAVKRIFKESLVIDIGRKSNFAVGDFNGDLSQDLAVVLTPFPGKLSEINADMPAWILRDLLVASRPGMPPLRVREGESLLAVIHGYGPDGWRDPQATQTYLLKNAVGSGVETNAKTEFVIANRGKKLPLLRGDLIAEVLRGRSGYLYYDEATYAWYDPRTFKGEPERRLVHSGMTMAK